MAERGCRGRRFRVPYEKHAILAQWQSDAFACPHAFARVAQRQSNRFVSERLEVRFLSLALERCEGERGFAVRIRGVARRDSSVAEQLHGKE